MPQGAADATTVGAHWSLDEPGVNPTAIDDSGNTNTGISSNVVGDGSGYTFNGTNSGVTVNDSLSLSPGANTFSHHRHAEHDSSGRRDGLRCAAQGTVLDSRR